MSRLLITALVFVLMFLMAPVCSAFVSLQPNGFNSVSVHEIGLSPDGIRVNIKNRPLRDVLRRVQNLTGIRFVLHHNVLNDRVTANFSAPDWKTTLTRLLEDFSVMGVGVDGLPRRVLILKNRDATSPPAKQTRKVQRKPAQSRIQVQKGPYPHIIRGPATVPDRPADEMTLSMLSPMLLMEPGLLNYLESVGVEVPEEMKRMYGMDGFPADMPLSPHVLHDPMLTIFLQSMGIEPPDGSPPLF